MSDAKYKICCKHEVDLKAANWFPFENREVNPKQCFNMGVSRTKNFCWSSALTGGPVKFRQADGAYRGPSLFKLRVRSVNSLGFTAGMQKNKRVGPACFFATKRI